MAKSTVHESDGKRKREEERNEVRRELAAVMAKFAAAELACSEVGAAPAALLERRLRSVARAAGADLEAWRASEPGAASGRSLAAEASKPGRKLCCALDGTGVPALPGETAGRTGKDGGRATTREAKVGVLWVSETDGEGRPRTVEGATALFTGIESAAETPGRESPLCGMLKAGRLDDVLADLRRRGGEAEECRKAVAHLAERRDRMRYDEHLAAGLPIGSGVVEAGCKNIVGRRMKCTGMRWSVAGANPVLWLRCARQCGWFDA